MQKAALKFAKRWENATKERTQAQTFMVARRMQLYQQLTGENGL
jgi:hypothetical protein